MIILHAFFNLVLSLLACNQQRLVPSLPRGVVAMKDAEHEDIRGRPQQSSCLIHLIVAGDVLTQDSESCCAQPRVAS